MNKYILGIIIIVSVTLISGCISNSNNNNETQVQTLAENGISIKFPGTWVSANSKNNETIVAVADPNFIDSSTGFGKVSVVIQKKTLNSTSGNSTSIEGLFNQTYKNLFSNSSYKLIAEGFVTVGKYSNAFECIYTVDENGTIKKHRAIWIEGNKDVFVILCTAPENEFDSQLKNFDFIINNFKIL
ncbi:MAG: hypothetical protein LBU74_04940 [Methanobacteriaceae archaeon]|jgi:hypothetical protein|nr:hypothetical protein [Candidatus Methanorudis spinitermitis]